MCCTVLASFNVPIYFTFSMLMHQLLAVVWTGAQAFDVSCEMYGPQWQFVMHSCHVNLYRGGA